MLTKLKERMITHSEKAYNETCEALNHDAADAIQYLSKLRHLVDTDGASPVAVGCISRYTSCYTT